MIKLDQLYEKLLNEVTKRYKLKHENLIKEKNELNEKLIKEENELKDNLKNKITKMKEQLESNLSEMNNILRISEQIVKYINLYKQGEPNIIKQLNYIINVDRKEKELNLIFQMPMKSLDASFNDNNIKYDEYYFNGKPIPKNIEFSEIWGNSLKISWEIDKNKIKDIDNEQIKYKVEMEKKKKILSLLMKVIKIIAQ